MLSIKKSQKQTPWLARWILKTLGRGIAHLLEEIFHPLPRVKPGELPTEEQLEEFYRSRRWQRLAYRMKRKHGWRCMRCGATAPGSRIVTDHVKSLRYNWDLKLDPTNMQILCESCNWLKGARDETDYRKRNPRFWRGFFRLAGFELSR